MKFDDANQLHKAMLPIIKYSGGKRWANDIIRSVYAVNETNRFIEPFAGGMASSLAVGHKSTVINDINPHLINLYRQVQLGFKFCITMEYSESRYSAYRDRFNDLIIANDYENMEAACLFYYLILSGFNGLCRFNKKGLFNVPFGKYKSVNYVKDFASYARLFEGWTFTCNDFESVSPMSDDFTFIDCPYDDGFVSYTKEGFSWDEQIRTAEWASKLNGPVICTNLSTQRIMDMYKDLGFDLRFVKVRRSISSKGDKREPVMEMMAFKNANIPSYVLNETIEV